MFFLPFFNQPAVSIRLLPFCVWDANHWFQLLLRGHVCWYLHKPVIYTVTCGRFLKNCAKVLMQTVKVETSGLVWRPNCFVWGARFGPRAAISLPLIFLFFTIYCRHGQFMRQWAQTCGRPPPPLLHNIRTPILKETQILLCVVLSRLFVLILMIFDPFTSLLVYLCLCGHVCCHFVSSRIFFVSLSLSFCIPFVSCLVDRLVVLL